MKHARDFSETREGLALPDPVEFALALGELDARVAAGFEAPLAGESSRQTTLPLHSDSVADSSPELRQPAGEGARADSLVGDELRPEVAAAPTRRGPLAFAFTLTLLFTSALLIVLANL